MKRLACALLIAGLCAVLPEYAASQDTGSVTGRVLLDKQTPVANATVLYQRVPKLARDSKGSIVELEPPVSGVVKTASDGSFQVKSLPPGEYYFCALPVQPDQLKASDLPDVTLAAGIAVSDVVLNVKTGVLLSIVIADPKALISAKTLTVGWMATSGGYLRATLAATTASGSTFTVATPKNSQGNLFLDGSLSIVDGSGKAVLMGTRSVPASPTDSAITVNLTVQ